MPKNDEEWPEEKKEFSPVIKYILIGVAVLITVVLGFWLSIEFGVNPPFEILGGAIAFGFLIWAVSNKFDDKIKFAKGVLIFVVVCLFANVFYLLSLWMGEKVYNDNSLWSPSVIAVLFFAVAIWFSHWFKGSSCKILITSLALLMANLFFVITAMVNGDEKGVRVMFITIFFSELVLAWGADKSLKKLIYFNMRKGLVPFPIYFIHGLHFIVLVGVAMEMIALPTIAIAKWPITSWQVVTAITSSLTAWYFIYAVWGRKYL